MRRIADSFFFGLPRCYLLAQTRTEGNCAETDKPEGPGLILDKGPRLASGNTTFLEPRLGVGFHATKNFLKPCNRKNPSCGFQMALTRPRLGAAFGAGPGGGGAEAWQVLEYKYALGHFRTAAYSATRQLTLGPATYKHVRRCSAA